MSIEKPEPGCGIKDFIHCISQLKSSNVPIDTNIMNIVFEHSVASEARLLRVCNAYRDVIPCFEKTLQVCGNDKQRIRLAEVNRLLLFICAPFSLQRQKTLLRVGKCIGKVLKMPVQQDCRLRERKYGYKLDLCRRNCIEKDLVCKRRVRMSELAACSVIAIEQHCGIEAEEFYTGLQSAIIGEEFPIQCKYKEISFPKLLNSEMKSHTSKPNLFGATNSVEDIPILIPKNGKLVPNPVLTRKAFEMLQFDRKALHSRPEDDQFESEEDFRIKNIRSRNFSFGMFKPAKFDESKLRQVPEQDKPIEIKFLQHGSVQSFGGASTNKSTIEISTQDFLPIFLQGARPIPDSSLAIFAPPSYKKNLPENNQDVVGQTINSWTDRAQEKSPQRFTVFGTTTQASSKWMPWYYETIIYTTPSYPYSTTQSPLPIFSQFNQNSLNQMNNESPYDNQIFNKNTLANMPANPLPFQDSFPNQFVYPTTPSNFINPWPTAPLFQWQHSTPIPQMAPQAPNLLANIRETADNYISAAFHALNTHQAEIFATNFSNQTTSSALSRLFSTIERVSPKIIENIRSKIDSLGQVKVV